MVVRVHGKTVVLELVFVPFDWAFAPFVFEKFNAKKFLAENARYYYILYS